MIISEKQILQLLAQLSDHIDIYDRLRIIGTKNQDYSDWLRDLKNEIYAQQSSKLKEIE